MLLSYLGNTFYAKMHIICDIHVRKIAVHERELEIERVSYISILNYLHLNNLVIAKEQIE